ncbi:MAG: hypothetical protein HQM00_11550 [Magnetococcales bacterium]|nr:hypothetical protein [Magnetococcales bacterium]
MSRLIAYDSYSMPLNPNNLVINLASIDQYGFDTDWETYFSFNAMDVFGNLITFRVTGNYYQDSVSQIQIYKNNAIYLAIDEITQSQMDYARNIDEVVNYTSEMLGEFYGGADSFIGSNGNDIFQGYGGDDILTGGGGSDQLNGGSGNNTVDGGDGNDTLVLAGDVTQYRFSESGGNVQVIYTGSDRTEVNTIRNIERVVFNRGGSVYSLQDLLAPEVTVQLYGPATVSEGAGSIIYTVRLSDSVGTPVTVYYATANGTALSFSDYTATSGTLIIPAGSTSVSFRVSVLDNTVSESNETFSVVISDPGSGVALGAVRSVITTVTDNDVPTSGGSTLESSTSRVLPVGVANLMLTGSSAIQGTGNILNNTLTGNVAANTLRGEGGADTLYGRGGDDLLYGGSEDDVLDGGIGADRMIGGTGNDLYIIDDMNDDISEDLNAGTDLVQSSITWTLGRNQESLNLIGTSSLNGTGNTLSNIIHGNMANNILRGDSGNDTLYGGSGNDTLYGGSGNDKMIGGSGNDKIIGESGQDRLSGGTGVDLFKFTQRSDGNDTITDFSSTQGDKLVFVSRNFGNIATGTLGSTRFRASSTGTANSTSQRFLFNTGTGVLKYDSDGSGSAAAVTMATLNVRTLSASQILIAAS